MPSGPSGEMTAAPIPAPRNNRVGSNCAGRDQTLPASKNVERYNIWDTRMPISPVIVKNAFPNALGLAPLALALGSDRKSTRLNSSHLVISYAVFCLKKKKI